MENWKDIKGYEGLYSVSDLGNVRSYHRGGRILKPGDSLGYLTVRLSKNGVCVSKKVHKLVAEEFLGHVPEGNQSLVVHHIDNDSFNNRLDNLELISHRANTLTHNEATATSKYKGVWWSSGRSKWYAQIRIGDDKVHLGVFTNEDDAGLAYQKALVENNLL